ncbi:unnamed protein product [Effrenium voratum]|nr:unnamed protein product [Effrenium voratum]
MADTPRVLSVQSHVVHGYVGNRAAVFPLQLLGFEVDVINSVQFSCHTGYPTLAGQRLSGEDLKTLAQGLLANEVLDHHYLLTGYIGTVSCLREILELRQKMHCRYVCDPVMGDNGHLYVPEELVAVYRSEVLSHVSILTPNQFEAELLTERKITSVQEAVGACDLLHAKGPEIVVLTTLDVPEATQDGEQVAMILSSAAGKWLLRVPLIHGGPFTGTGDMTAAMILAWMHRVPQELPLALEKAAAVLQGVLSNTMASSKAFHVAGKRVSPELRIIESKTAIESPIIRHRCQLLEPPSFAAVLFEQDALREASLKSIQSLSSVVKVGIATSSSSDRFSEVAAISRFSMSADPAVLAEHLTALALDASCVLAVGTSSCFLSAASAVGSQTVALLPQGRKLFAKQNVDGAHVSGLPQMDHMGGTNKSTRVERVTHCCKTLQMSCQLESHWAADEKKIPIWLTCGSPGSGSTNGYSHKKEENGVHPKCEAKFTISSLDCLRRFVPSWTGC